VRIGLPGSRLFVAHPLEVNGLDDWFKVREVGPGTWAIDDNGQDTIYLIEGDESALLIDTGWGVGDLPALVKSLTDRPVTVVNSHGHPDHAYGDDQFPEVYISPADMPTVRSYFARREEFLESTIAKIAPPGFDASTWATKQPNLLPVRAGHVFHLGKRSLEVLPLAGHSPGSIIFLDRKNRQLFTGDSILIGTLWLYLDESRPLREYEKNLRAIQAKSHAWDHILAAHGPAPLTNALLDDIIAGVEKITSGRVVGYPERTFVGEGLRVNFQMTAIIYNPDNVG
jgi:hydroxyacylglutathione hydrolase